MECLIGTHQGGIRHRHLAGYLDKFTFRFNRRRSPARGLPFHRLTRQAVAIERMLHSPIIGAARAAKNDYVGEGDSHFALLCGAVVNSIFIMHANSLFPKPTECWSNAAWSGRLVLELPRIPLYHYTEGSERAVDNLSKFNRLIVTGILALAMSVWASGTAYSGKLYLLVTIDVETTSGCTGEACYPGPIEDRILGLEDGRAYGIQMMMDILENHNMRGTFFVNAYLDAYYPEAEIVKFVREIVTRGHDVQFHAHEEFRCFKFCGEADMPCRRRCTTRQSYMAGNSFEGQREILAEGAQNIARWSGTYPIAFRGGAYDADLVTLRALADLGIPIDTSLSGPHHVLAKDLPVNRIAEHDGVIEVPLYSFKENLVFRSEFKVLNIENTTLLEQEFLLESAVTHDVKSAVLMMHSFSFCRRELACPIQQNIERFDRLLSFAQANPQIEVITFTELFELYSQRPETLQGSGFVPETGYLMTLYRSAVRFNMGYKNRVFLLANGLLLGLVILVLLLGIRFINRRRLPK